MDDIYLYIIGGVIIAVFIIILNHKKQKTKVTDFLKDARTAEPVFMQASVEKKLKTLKIALYGNTTGINLQTAGSIAVTEAKKQTVINQLNQLEKNYADKAISMRVYDEQLYQLITQISE